MRPVTPSSYRLASYRPLPFLRAVFQSLARAIFTDAERAESCQPSPRKPTPMDTAAASFSQHSDCLRKHGAFAKHFDGREELGWSVIIFLGKSEWRVLSQHWSFPALVIFPGSCSGARIRSSARLKGLLCHQHHTMHIHLITSSPSQPPVWGHQRLYCLLRSSGMFLHAASWLVLYGPIRKTVTKW